jgi:hypothetical protein
MTTAASMSGISRANATSMTGANRDALPILTESPRGHVIAARDDPRALVPPLPSAPGCYWWRIPGRVCGVAAAAHRVVWAARVNGMVPTWGGRVPGGIRPLPGYL